MWNMLWPILIVVTANTIYNITTKATPGNINPFASLTATYFVAMVCSVGMFFITGSQKNLVIELSKTNWTAYALGVAVLALEFGYICIYRSGWKVSTASLFANILLACVLLIVGIFVYKESIDLRQIIGMLACGIGLILIVK